jgi:hypothetical protein
MEIFPLTSALLRKNTYIDKGIFDKTLSVGDQTLPKEFVK